MGTVLRAVKACGLTEDNWISLALQGKLWKEFLDKGEARERYMVQWKAKQEVMAAKRQIQYLRVGNPFKDMVLENVMHDRRWARFQRNRQESTPALAAREGGGE